MNSRLVILIKGELSRLNKYGVFSISILVAFIWGAVLLLVNDSILGTLLPMVLLLDATMMSIMYIGAEMHFEKSESTISTMLVTPVSNAELVLSKVLGNIIHNLVSSLLIIGVFYFAGVFDLISDPGIKIFPLLFAVIATTSTFTVVGLVLSYTTKDFTGMLVNMFVLVIFLMIPSVLLMFGVLEGDVWENIMILNPIQAAQDLIGGGFDSYEYTYKYWVSLGYIVFGGLATYFLLAVPKFQNYAVKQSGV